jgi:flagellar basal-body rod protein FlgG
MIRALKTAASGMEAQQLQIDIIANNMANVNTVGFKKARGEFQDLYYQQLRSASGPTVGQTASPIGLEIGQGVRMMSSQKMFSTGEMMQTGNPLDLAIEGRGFFKIQKPDGGFAYTRAGNFKLNADRQIVTADGYQVDPGIEVPEDAVEVSINREGLVTALRQGAKDVTRVGQITLVTFQNPAGLQSMGRSLYEATPASGEVTEAEPGTDGLGTLVQRQLESSNVKVVEEMIDLISAQRAYEINSKVVQATDQMLREATNLR